MGTEQASIRLTAYSHGAGCGCKLSPRVLGEILRGQTVGQLSHPQLLVGNDTRDDAAVFDLGNGMGLVSTTDFFMPIVDDPYEFGRIASANAISDVYAMGGEPILAIAILGWPIEKLGPDIAAEVVRGSRDICQEAGIPLAGGHSIDTPEPIYGLAVNGLVELAYLKRNSSAADGDSIYLTKPLGIGIITTAHKRGTARQEDLDQAIYWMTTLNRIGPVLARTPGVSALTDVTGYGLLGHLVEIARASQVQITIRWEDIPILPWIDAYINMDAIPGGTRRNWFSYGQYVEIHHPEALDYRKQRPTLEQVWEQFKPYLAVLCDPQTSGGLLACYSHDSLGNADGLGEVLSSFGLVDMEKPIGKCYRASEPDQACVIVEIAPEVPSNEVER